MLESAQRRLLGMGSKRTLAYERKISSGIHQLILLLGIIGGSVSERPNKNRHTVGIDYFHCNPRLNC